tara:strand:- start:485 stop:862 length:378 start_codon:yes stop_codon:yes gene_type:complete
MVNIQPQNPNLIETTTPLQSRRGNRQFFCQKHKVSYISYANGYVRREINANYISPYTASQNVYKVQDQFVLNRRKSISTQWGFCSRVIIKEHCPQARMDMIDRISSNYKGYRGRFTNPGHTLIMK